MIQTAFQIGGFQFNAFQEGIAVGAGANKRFILAQALARRRKAVRESPTPEEVAEILVAAQARTRLVLRPAPYVAVNLAPLAAAIRQKDRDKAFEEFMELVEAMMEEMA